MQQPGRKYTAGRGYRYGFNGKEKCDEIYGQGNSLDFGARILDSRLGKWFSVDPLQKKYTDLSPYQFCANSPISSKDPDGRLIIFINGLWGWPNGVTGGGTVEYWGEKWVELAQDRMGDHAKPRFYDGSLGGTAAFGIYRGLTNFKDIRISAGKDAGYKDAAAIIGGLNDGETIKIVTNSMGAAFARGFTKGILQYQAEENDRRTTFNQDIDNKISMLETESLIKGMTVKTKANPIPQTTVYSSTEQEALSRLKGLNTKISQLRASKKQLLNVVFESETDLSSHQIDFANEDVHKNYYMSTKPENMQIETRFGVRQKDIKGAINLGVMSGHHSSGADASKLPASSYPDPNPENL